jgi:hypothetical protein
MTHAIAILSTLAIGYNLGRAHTTRRHFKRLLRHADYYGAGLIDPHHDRPHEDQP